MEALDLIVLGRQLAKIGETVLRGSAAPPLPTGQSLVLRDVFAHPDSSITEITARTGLPQSYVSESVSRLRDQGMLDTSPDPADRRRTLARWSNEHPRAVARKGAASADAALLDALGEPELLAAVEALSRRLRPADPGPILQQVDSAREHH